MKTKLTVAATALLGLFAAHEAFGFNKSMYPYELKGQGAALGCEVARAGDELELGKWYTNFSVVKKYAEDNGIPMLAVWSNHGCVHCWYTDVCFVQDSFKAWQQSSDAGQILYCYMAGGDDTLDQVNSAAYNWMWHNKSLSAYPFVALYWKVGNTVKVEQHLTGDAFCAAGGKTLSFTDATIPTRVDNITATLDRVFADWSPVKYTGGVFANDEETEGNRLEAESGTTSVTIDLVRDAKAAGEAALNILTATYPAGKGGSAASDTQVRWAAGETAKKVNLPVNTAGLVNGNTITLLLKDENGEGHSTNRIWYVEKEISESNPLWIGERTAETLQWGEWTMDFDVAKAKAASALISSVSFFAS